MRHKRSPLDEIAVEYTQALAAGEFERAAGWFAVARFVSTREDDASGTTRLEPLHPVRTPKASAGGTGA